MEFSFDRSNDSAQLRSNSQSNTQTTPDDGVDTSTISNERLRKAIEKNRARQAERNRNISQGPAQTAYTAPPQKPQSNEEVPEQASLFANQQRSVNTEIPARETPPLRAKAEERVHNSQTARNSESNIPSRRSVARADEAEFVPVKRTPKKVSGQISYSTTSRKKVKPIDPTLIKYLVKGSWIFCGIMILRLIFAHGGVVDFYSQRSLYDDRLVELDKIKKENMQLVREIERMQTDTAFQKKLVRDNLGFIASDEFLVLFPKEKEAQ